VAGDLKEAKPDAKKKRMREVSAVWGWINIAANIFFTFLKKISKKYFLAKPLIIINLRSNKVVS